MTWTILSLDDALALYNPAERAIVAADSDLVANALLDISCRVREVVASNRSNLMAACPAIPRSFRACALALLRRDLLLRYDLEISESRKTAATEAESYLIDARAKKVLVADEQGNMPAPAGSSPSVFASAPVYRTGRGLI